MEVKIFDNVTDIVRDDMEVTISKDSKVSIAAACFSMYAYKELKKQLESVDEFRFIFTSPTFVTEKAEKQKREFYIPRLSRERSLYGTEFEIKLRNEMTQKAIAKECADWIKGKARFKSNITGENMGGFMTVENENKQVAYMPINGFTTVDIGCERGNNSYNMINRFDAPFSASYMQLFETLWKDKEKLQDVTDVIIENITTAYNENSPEFIYFMTLYHVFSEFLDDISEDELPNEATGFKQSKIWNMLYDFQKDATLAIINKLERYNGCILADSVGLGKTFTALAVVKYYENRNKSVLVLCPKKLAENWNTYKDNYVNNPIAADRLNYDVLFHTDLSRTHGFSNGLELDRLNWENYDLVVIDESHNFRNGTGTHSNTRENRYVKLMDKIIRPGVKTKVLMLSATPVNNRFVDLKNQLAIAYEGNSENINKKLNTSKTIEEIFKQAQKAFNAWSKLDTVDRTTDALLRALDFDFFELLDSVTIARSRKHIEKYYDTLDEEKSTIDNKVYKKAVNFEMLKQMLSGNVLDGDEAYEFTWVGKKAAIVEANTPIKKTLRPCPEESVNWDSTENLYIEGDNLEVLKLLQESYLGKVKMIYIDPPYNTGSDFIYNDDFKITGVEYSNEIGEKDEDGNRMFKNTDSNGRFHSDWCSMIYSRLLLARNLLSDDGVIFISIDDNEQENLKKCCDEIYGEHNFITQIAWEKVHTRKNSAINFSSSHEYILCYAKIRRNYSGDIVGFKRNLLPRDNTDAYSNPDNDPKGPWKADPITAHNYYAADYTITKPNGFVIHRPQDRYWAYSEESIQKMINENAIIWGAGNSMPMIKRYLCDVQNGLVPITLFSREFAGDSSQAKKQIDNLFEECKGIFDYTKPVKLIKRLLQIGTTSEDLVLDFFSGSSTTAHAVMQLNAQDGGHRKFLMVQWTEKTDEKSAAYKAGYKNICEIGKERIRRAAKKIAEEHPDVKFDNGFRVLKLDESNMNKVYYKPEDYSQGFLNQLESNIKSDRTDLDLLFGCLLEWGLPLSFPYTSEQIDGCTVHNYNDGDLIACFDENIPDSVIKAIAKKQPLRAVFRDSSFTDSPSKINVDEIFKLTAPNTRVKVI